MFDVIPILTTKGVANDVQDIDVPSAGQRPQDLGVAPRDTNVEDTVSGLGSFSHARANTMRGALRDKVTASV